MYARTYSKAHEYVSAPKTPGPKSGISSPGSGVEHVVSAPVPGVPDRIRQRQQVAFLDSHRVDRDGQADGGLPWRLALQGKIAA